MDYNATKAQVTSAVLVALIRLAKGGFVLNHSSSNENEHPCLTFSSKSSLSWEDQLKEIAYTSVSFPNGTNHDKSDNINGSPSDVDIRAALTLYNRVKKRHYELQNSSRTRSEDQHGIIKLPKKQKRTIPLKEIVFDIISDLGTHRRVIDAKSLANLLSIEIEKELSTSENPRTDTNGFDPDPAMHDSFSSNDKPATTTVFDIRPSDSGIICLVSSLRSQQLHDAGRVPCTQCIKWCKGMKGLWWHQLKEHGVDYSDAMEVAAGSVNELAVVKYQEHSACVVLASTDDAQDETGVLPSSPQEDTNSFDADDVDVFDLVKKGDLVALIHQIENGFELPDSHLDRNGANCLHWAAGRGHLHIVSYLIEKCNYRPNLGQVGKRSFSGRTPLHWACRNGHLNIVQYLIEHCNVDIEAKTLDGTTAFCWAAWQGHLDVMKFLHQNGCDINCLNSFGCNALLWCSQGAATPEIFSWLHYSGADFSLVNDNGHSALHKSAQRGNVSACKWLVDMFLHQESGFDGCLLIGPDAEGACPSDLCGMNGHENLAEWLSKQECNFVRRYLCPAYLTNNAQGRIPKYRKLCDCTTLPMWLREATFDSQDAQQLRYKNGAIGRMKAVLNRSKTEKNQHYVEPIERFKCNGNLSEID